MERMAKVQALLAGPRSFSQALTQRADAAKRKGERTRSRLKAAAAHLLEERGYRELRVSDINEAAGVSNASFYVYFQNKEEITGEILKEFLDQLATAPRSSARDDSMEEAIYRSILSYIRRFSANPGLMYCLIQFGDEVPAFGRLWIEFNESWADRMVHALRRHGSVAFGSDEELTIATTALGLMADGLLRLLYLEEVPKLAQSVATLGDAEAGTALLLTRLWFRALYAKEMTWHPGPTYRLIEA